MQIERIKSDQELLRQVRELWRSNSSTLGFFPEGAFSEYAEKGQIIGALAEGGRCVGYLLYRVSGERAFVVHLCVRDSVRERGIARDLINNLFETTKDLQGVCLWCRRDYAASDIWQELGFVALADRPGRSLEGKELTFWKRDNECPTLFGSIMPSDTSSKLRVVIDASVFFDLLNGDTARNQESRSLQADWLAPSVDLCITDEMFNEINRRKRRVERQRSRSFARRHEVLSPLASHWQHKQKDIRKLYPPRMSAQDKSDLRHLAKALASGVQFFITRDGPLLKKAERLYKEFGISVVRPSDIVIHLNELRRETAYQPARFDRTLFEARPIKTGEARSLNEFFQCANLGEGQAQFQEYLGHILAYPDKFECVLISDSELLPIALVAYGREMPGTLEIPLLRVRQGHLTSTLARNLAFRALRLSANETRPLIRIGDPFISEVIQEALREVRYVQTGNSWMKIGLPFTGDSQELLNRIIALPPALSEVDASCRREIITAIQSGNEISRARSAMQLERLLWPAKITDLEISNYILPIKPRWAQELFDEGLSKQTLFGARPELGLNREGVYYRSQNLSRGLAATSRILCVSSDKKHQDSMQLRACSYVDNVAVGRPKELFRQYRRLGVYEWRDVYKLAGENLSNEIMAIQFSDTEPFSRPIPWQQLQQVLGKEGCPSRIQSPHRISSQTFFKLYRLGTAQ